MKDVNIMTCTKQHRYDPQYSNLPDDQGGQASLCWMCL